jgi:low affinity Fe/Cu permease
VVDNQDEDEAARAAADQWRETRASLDELDRTLHARSTRFITAISRALGSFTAVVVSAVIVVAWVATGPLFDFSETWQKVITAGVTVITFSMVVIIQNTQNRDSRAIQTKLDAIMRALDGVDDGLIGLEEQPERIIRHAQSGVRVGVDTNGDGEDDSSVDVRDTSKTEPVTAR